MTNGLWKIGELAKRTGVSIRTLHHYDEIGLLSPSHRTESGHRLYGREEVVRLQQVLSLRQSGFSLEQIREMLASRRTDARRVIA
jgi:DNA-binding transcriptional MerR regulator